MLKCFLFFFSCSQLQGSQQLQSAVICCVNFCPLRDKQNYLITISHNLQCISFNLSNSNIWKEFCWIDKCPQIQNKSLVTFFSLNVLDLLCLTPVIIGLWEIYLFIYFLPYLFRCWCETNCVGNFNMATLLVLCLWFKVWRHSYWLKLFF